MANRRRAVAVLRASNKLPRRRANGLRVSLLIAEQPSASRTPAGGGMAVDDVGRAAAFSVHLRMTTIFRKVQALYGTTAKKEKEEILGKDATDSEATPEVMMEQVGTSTSTLKNGIGISLSTAIEKSTATEESIATAPPPQPRREFRNNSPRREHEVVGDAQKTGESNLHDIPSLANDAPLNNYINALNQIEVSDDENPAEMTSKGSKDVASPTENKRRLRKGTTMTTAKQTKKGTVAVAAE
ncbi:hypothetical protein Dimus_003064 [Dionaea muscipula]